MSTDYLQEPEAPRRRVSIATDPVFETRKLSYVPGDADRNRRISVATDWAMDGSRKPSQQLNLSHHVLLPVRFIHLCTNYASGFMNEEDADISRKSTLAGKTPDTLSLYSHYSNYPQENGKLGVNGDLSPSKKNSTVDSISEKIRYLERESPNKAVFMFIVDFENTTCRHQRLYKQRITYLTNGIRCVVFLKRESRSAADK
uniref:Uncharacterized protein n=1 Tax=Timema bartmani TaxID=61472 RepID=A0A7R9I3H1_9NEOP|nr:unnamed protein product [Timema bartmani]